MLRRFVQSFEEPESKSISEFWNQIAHHETNGSGPIYLSGWITAFCAFDVEGEPLLGHGRTQDHEDVLDLDGVLYHRVDTNDIPPSYCAVDIKVDDNGELLDATMTAGAVALEIMDSEMISPAVGGKHNAIRPVSGWILYEKSEAN